MPSHTAQPAVFGIFELVEHILLNLDPFDIIRARRIHPVIKDIIDSSFKLRRKLFLERDERIKPKLWSIQGRNKVLAVEDGTNVAVMQDLNFICHRFIYNPMLFKAYGDVLIDHQWRDIYGLTHTWFRLDTARLKMRRYTAHTAPSRAQLYRNMYITQPPVTEVKMILRCEPSITISFLEERTVTRVGGLRYGDILDDLRSWLEYQRPVPIIIKEVVLVPVSPYQKPPPYDYPSIYVSAQEANMVETGSGYSMNPHLETRVERLKRWKRKAKRWFR